jgi:hypothetical protein
MRLRRTLPTERQLPSSGLIVAGAEANFCRSSASSG